MAPLARRIAQTCSDAARRRWASTAQPRSQTLRQQKSQVVRNQSWSRTERLRCDQTPWSPTRGAGVVWCGRTGAHGHGHRDVEQEEHLRQVPDRRERRVGVADEGGYVAVVESRGGEPFVDLVDLAPLALHAHERKQPRPQRRPPAQAPTSLSERINQTRASFLRSVSSDDNPSDG